MAISAKEQAQANEDFAVKMKLERTFRPEVKNIFGRMVRSYAATVARTGRAPLASVFRAEWEGAIRKQFDRSQRKFTGTVLSMNVKSLDNLAIKQEEEGDESVFPFALLAWADLNAPKDADQISGTNQRNYDDSLAQARTILQEDGEAFGNRDLSLTASAILKRKMNGRVGAITSFETQSSAESTKLIEAEIASGFEPSVLAPTGFLFVTAVKVWVTIGDKLVRDIHQAVNGQIRKITEAFVVNGQQLMNPGDTSRGASADNVVNCRCSAIYRI